MNLVQAPKEENISDLLDHLQWIRDSSRPESVPDAVYLCFEVSGDHAVRPSWDGCQGSRRPSGRAVSAAAIRAAIARDEAGKLLQPAVHRAILIADVERFGDPARTNAHQLAVRDVMYRALRESFSSTLISWADCVAEDRGDGVLVFVPPEVPKSWLVTRLPAYLAEALVRHNAAHPEEERIRLRVALHAGEVHKDPHGFAGVSVNRAFRLIEAPASRTALRDSSGVVALIVSDWFYEEVVRHHPAARPSCFRQVHVVMKETEMTAWVRVLESGEAPARREIGQAVPGSAALSHLTRVGDSLPPSPSGVRYSLPPDVTALLAGMRNWTALRAR